MLPLVGSMMCVSGLMVPAFSAASIIERPIRSFTLEHGLKNSSFKQHSCPARGDYAAQPHQRRVVGRLDDVGKGFSARAFFGLPASQYGSIGHRTADTLQCTQT